MFSSINLNAKPTIKSECEKAERAQELMTRSGGKASVMVKFHYYQEES
jgi:hypothetical protein